MRPSAGGRRRSFSDDDRVQSHVPTSSHPSNLRATKQPFYGLLQLNDWDATTGRESEADGRGRGVT